MKSKFKRFDGTGNTMLKDDVGHVRHAWEVVCKKCAKTMTVPCRENPEAIYTKFTRAGWRLGVHYDECDECAEAQRASYKAAKGQRQETKRLEEVDALSVANVLLREANGGGLHLPADASDQFHMAIAIITQITLNHSRFDLHKEYEMLALIQRFWELDPNTERYLETRRQLKVAAFSTDPIEATNAVTAMRRALHEQEMLEFKITEKEPPPPDAIAKFRAKYNNDRLVAKPPVSKLDAKPLADLSPVKPMPPKPNETAPTTPQQPKWLQQAHERMKGKL